ncbi:amidohydrolase [Vibrio sp. NTOU-M3]|uniref:amidohydrolase n=1 Tax=Vibrio sp. NTOU-M3 TaxID=3234954 RepID=UPI00349F4C63
MHKKIIALSIATGLLAGCNAEPPVKPIAAPAQVTAADTIYFGGDILTMDGETPNYVEAVATLNGKILFAGSKDDVMPYKFGQTNLVNLKGQTLMPGFIDAHGHISQLAVSLSNANLAAPPYGTSDTFENLKQTLKDYIKNNHIKPGEWVVGTGYDTSILPNHPHKELLDEVSTENPILIIHSSGHIGVVNSKAMSLAGITNASKNPKGGVIQRGVRGEPNGVLEESAMWPVMLKLPQPDNMERLKQLDEAQRSYASFGVTTTQDGRTTPMDFELLHLAQENERLYLDVVAYPAIEMVNREWLPKFEQYSRYQNHLRIGGVKLSLDGSLPGKTAHLSEHYYVPPHGHDSKFTGYPAFDDKTVNHLVQVAWENDWQLLVHCNGDAAGDQMLNAIEQLGDISSKDWRPVMIHAQTVREDQLDEMKKLNVIPSFEMTHPYLFGDYYIGSVLGKARGERNNPAGSAARRQMPFTFHTDSPVVIPDMMMTVWSGVNRVTRNGKTIGEEQKVTPYQALQAITTNAAYQNFEENHKGSISTGKDADLVILNRNPLKVDPMEIKNIQVMTTIKDGHPVWQRTERK